jgi:hypothetical protein
MRLKGEIVMIKNIILISCFICFSFTMVLAQPIINNVSGVLTHKGIIILTGEQFGSKIPAAPLIWDDCEGLTVNNDAAVTAVWDEAHPQLSGAAYEEARTRYRTIPYRSTPAPHTHSKTYLSGGHHQYADNDPAYIPNTSYRDVLVTVDSGTADKDTWFATWYYRLDPDWESPCNSYTNHKTSVVNGGDTAWSKPFAYDSYWGVTDAPCTTDNNSIVQIGHGASGGVIPAYSNAPASDNPRLNWVRYERKQYSHPTNGYRNTYVNNKLAGYYTSGSFNQGNTRSFTIGGYYRFASDISNTSTYRGCADCYRYFDDMYVDTTFSRVMLGDNATYADCTIIEPQIPSAWADTSITCSVNIGKFPDNAAVYLFVFDETNNKNPVGYKLITVGSIENSMRSPLDFLHKQLK